MWSLFKRFQLTVGFSLCSLLFFSSTSSAQTHQGEVAELIQLATTQTLASDPQWLSLIHSEYQKRSPQEILEETITGFFFDAAPQSENALCTFPARLDFLSRHLPLDAQLNKQKTLCTDFNEWYGLLDPQKITLIFPSSFVNNPASAFGHTFIRIDSAESAKGGNLLAYAANFSAQTGNDPGVLYAMKGVFGGYNGYFAVLPYYTLVSKYSDLESRDIWEYPLNFSPDEVKLLVEHLWEIKREPFPYYYFDENCSYQLLSILDVARPSLQLSKRFHLWVLPLDTVREAMNDETKLVGKGVLYPSVGSKLLEKMRGYSSDQLELVERIASLEVPLSDPSVRNLDSSVKAKVLDLAYDFVEFNNLRKKDHDPKFDALSFALLKERSSVEKESRAGELPGTILSLSSETQVIKTPPENGHLTKRLTYGVGSTDGEAAHRFKFRPAYHSLSDPLPGFDLGSAIEMGEISISQNLTKDSDSGRESGSIGIDRFDLLSIKSLTPSQGLYSPLSWALKTGYESHLDNTERLEIWTLQAGFGKTYSLGSASAAYLLLTPHAAFGDEVEKGYSLIPTIEGGIFSYWRNDFSTVLSLQGGYAAAGQIDSLFKGELENNYLLSSNDRVSLSVTYEDYLGEVKPEVMVSYSRYF